MSNNKQIRVYTVTGVNHGSIVYANDEKEAIEIFQRVYDNEEIICVKNNKQSSVDWLIAELGEYFPQEIGGIELMVAKAKAMHKEEIIDAHESGMADGYYFEGSQSDYEAEGTTKYFGEQHYERTFGV